MLALCIALLAGCAGEAQPEDGVEAMRTYTDAAGREVDIPQHPQRVIVQQFNAEMLTLGIPMIGTNKTEINLTAMKGMLDDVADIGNIFSMNFEQVIALNPDLIIIPEYVEEKIREGLSKIAPTVVVDYSAGIYSRLRAIGDLFGKGQEAQAWIKSYEAKAEETKERLKDLVKPDETVSAFIFFNDKEFYVYGKQMIGATLYGSLGLTPPPKVQAMIDKDESMLWENISLEVLPEYVGDKMIMIVRNDDPAVVEAAQGVFDGPLWQTLPAVKNGQAYVVEYKWGFYDPITMEFLLEELPDLFQK